MTGLAGLSGPRWAAHALVALVALLPLASGGTQDPATYPEGILEVSHSPILDGQDFTVSARLEGAAETVAVTVCRFTSADAPGPEVCYMNLAAAPAEAGSWSASTAAGQHPDWRDGWVIGYKVTAQTPSGELHAPDRLAPDGQPDYYRLVVGEPEVEGSAVVEDTAVGPAQEEGDGTRGSPGLAAPALAVLLASLGLAAKRRRPA